MQRLILFAFILVSIQHSRAQSFKNVPSRVVIFPEVSSGFEERDMALSPDGSEMYYTIQGNQHSYSIIVFRKKTKGVWSSPEVASFSGKYGDLEPAFTDDGKRLFFSSNRSLTNDDTIKDYDIWYVERQLDQRWGEPKNVGAPVNTLANEFYPSVSKTGNLYFTAEYENGVGKEDIFVSEWRDGKYQQSVALDTAVNSKLWEFNAYVSPDEKTILFTSYGRKGDLGGGDLYLSRKDGNGKWQPAKALTILNSSRLDYCPYISPDQQVLFFTSGRHDIPKIFAKPITYGELVKLSNSAGNASENIYWISWKTVLESLK